MDERMFGFWKRQVNGKRELLAYLKLPGLRGNPSSIAIEINPVIL
jgi:hypothetical protein